MNLETQLKERSHEQCELCGSSDNLAPYGVAPSDGSANQSLYLCDHCRNQLDTPSELDRDHWRCLNESMWSTVAAVQVMAYRILNALSDQDRLEMLYLEDDVLQWAQAQALNGSSSSSTDRGVSVRDSNGTILSEGDSVTLIKDLEVKGGGFTAKRGTIVKNIRLTDDPKLIEGKINGSTIVLVAAYMKKV
ncbi:alkylphosphonate utilization protein [Sulfuricurvum sp.]|jgi:protein PhnA|uniref:PhnA domain-containing protein n=1 Tax=Sulfuricurvum sp. TaxID=2025608 RepID=UPI00262719A6|nr:alkylphosphonate utilization protein [Sulfuricurvum sp.]MDD3596425.1 PhnA domain-containing protein [Sulfuricurvum sp.]MDD4950234.1 PhnA domain-containing protein [Sulfuricurvum sp.]